jgi:glycosyltransferase involved in cell wall biosynthesis
MEETRVYKQMMHEWMMLSTSLFSHYQGMQQCVKSYIEYFERLYSYLFGEGNVEFLTKRENELNVLNALKLPISEEEIGDKTGKRKILVLTWEFPPHIVGGLARHVHGLTKSLSQMGYEIHVITAHQAELPVYERLDGVFVHRVKPLHENEKDFLMWIGGLNIALAEKAEALAREYQFDYIHAHDWLVGAAASVLKDTLAIPLVTTIHATEFGRNNGIYTEMQRFIYEKERKLVEQSDQIIVCSDYMKQEVQQLFNPSIEKMSTIPNGIDSEPEIAVRQEDLLADVPIDRSRKMIFSIGRIVKEKGFDTLIEAAIILKEKGSNVYFLIAGKGPMLDEYRRKVEELQLTDTVFFIGFIDDNKRNALFELCDIAVFPSLYEPFGIVALESMKANKPTIVSNTGGLKGIVQHLKTGLLMVPGSTDSLIEQIMRLLNDTSLAKQVGENGKKVVESLFSWNRVAEETKRVFEEVKINGKL